MSRKILWIVGSLNQLGGGERLLLEGEKYFTSKNIDTKILTWSFNQKSLFSGLYNPNDIVILDSLKSPASRSNFMTSSFRRIFQLRKIYSITKKFNPDLIICQSEYDMILAGIISKLTGINFIVLIFGQTYQFVDDNIKYSKPFIKHLNEIVNSCEGYRTTIPLNPPKLTFLESQINNIIANVRIYFIKRSLKLFTLSEQVKWEVNKIYNLNAEIFSPGISRNSIKKIKPKIKSVHKIKFLMVNRLVDKKRVSLAIKSFKNVSFPFELNIVGIGPNLKKLKSLTKRLDLSNNINFMENIDDKRLELVYTKSHCFINLDVADFNITVIEAMSYGLKVLLTTDYSINNQFLDYKGIYVSEPNADSLTRALKKIFLEKDKKNLNMSILKYYTWEYNFDKILNTIENE